MWAKVLHFYGEPIWCRTFNRVLINILPVRTHFACVWWHWTRRWRCKINGTASNAKILSRNFISPMIHTHSPEPEPRYWAHRMRFRESVMFLMSLKVCIGAKRSGAHTHFGRKFSKYCQLILENWLRRWLDDCILVNQFRSRQIESLYWTMTYGSSILQILCIIDSFAVTWFTNFAISQAIQGCHLHCSYF